MQGRRRTPGCLDDETLAAYVDGGPTAEERSQVELHLAGCRECFAVFTEAVKTVQAMRDDGLADVVGSVPVVSAEPTSAVVVPLPARRSALARRLVMVGGLAAAAVLAVAVWWPRPERPELVDLVAAVGQRRPVEGRLTGGFKFGPIESPTRGVQPGSDWRLRAAAGKLAEDAKGTDDARLLGALGAAHLVSRDFEGAVKYLDQAINRAPEDALLRSDLAAALLARGEAHGDGEDLRNALVNANIALAKRPDLKEALFNRALVLQRLDRKDEERVAWRSYLAVDGSSEWAAVAKQRLRELEP